MSYVKVKSIRFDKTNKKVFLTSAESNIRPLYFRKWECNGYSMIWDSKGYDEMMKHLLEDIVDGNLHFYSGKFREFKRYFCKDSVKQAFPELSWDYIRDELKKLPVVTAYDWKKQNPDKEWGEYEKSQESQDYVREYERLDSHRRDKIYECYNQFLLAR